MTKPSLPRRPEESVVLDTSARRIASLQSAIAPEQASSLSGAAGSPTPWTGTLSAG